mgnify:FL=1
MEIFGEKGIGKFLKVLLQVCFWGGIAVLIVLPFILQMVGLNLNATAFVIYPNGIALLVIVRQFIGQFDSLKNRKPFCIENVKRLKTSGVASLIETALWTIDLLYTVFLAKGADVIIVLVLAFLIILFAGVSIAFYILAELIKQATEYKEENELTI